MDTCPKWCHLNLELGHTGECEKYNQLRRAKSLRLLSLHLESYSLDSQGCGDQVNPYFGELDHLTRAGHNLRKLSLSVRHDHSFLQKYGKRDPCARLEKFVKNQKHLEEFGIYIGSCGNSKWMANLLKYVEKSVKVLTIENISVNDIFSIYTFPKLEVFRFEYILFYDSEMSFDLSVLMSSLKEVLSIPSLKTLSFVQYQRYGFRSYGRNNKEDKEAKTDFTKIKEIPFEFWKMLREELDKNKGKALKIIYHKMDDSDISAKISKFRETFSELPPGQVFEYQVEDINFSYCSRYCFLSEEIEDSDDSEVSLRVDVRFTMPEDI